MKISKNNFISLIESTIREILNEDRYKDSIIPDNSRAVTNRNLGYNPLTVDNGGHASNDVVSQPSTYDYNGETFQATDDNRRIVNQNKCTIYKIKNFGNDTIPSTMSLFGSGAYGTNNLRTAIDLLNGGAKRNGKYVMYRTITLDKSVDKAKKSGWMIDTFWEFSLDNGRTWNILKPKPLENLKQAK